MGILKIITPGSQARGFGEPIAQLIKISSRGLLGADRTQFIKRAGAEFAHELANIKFAADEIPIHLLAIGATEDYGPNRNADGFRRQICRDFHHTFVKYARFYRDHANKNPAKSFGLVKASTYHEPMKRIELICALNGSPERASANGGLLADREMEKLSRDEDIAVSMACRVPYDVCSFCHNKAQRRENYCDSIENGGHCKAGGLKHNLGRLLDNGHVLHADNIDPLFFDISHVFRPADRIAYVSGQLQKAASAGHVISGAELAELTGLSVPYELLVSGDLPADAARHVKLAHMLADIERNLPHSNRALAFLPALQPPLGLPTGGHNKFAQVLHALAAEKIVLPVRDFIRLTTTLDEKQAADAAAVVQAQLPGIYGRLIDSPKFEELVRDNPYVPATCASPGLRMWALKHASALSVADSHVRNRVMRAALMRSQPVEYPAADTEKLAAAGGPAVDLARHYALYKLAFLSSIPDTSTDLPLTATSVVLQNYVN